MRGLVRAALLLVAAVQDPKPAPESEPPKGAPTRVALAVIVNSKNPTTNLTFNELRAYCKFERKFWPDRSATKLVLPNRKSTEKAILLDRVYEMTEAQQRDYFRQMSFRGEITAPKCLGTARGPEQAIAQVRQDPQAFTVVLVSDLPADLEGVRALSIDGKRPGDAGYELVGEPPEEAGDKQLEGE